MAILAGRRSENYFGLRPMDPMRDLRGVADLIEEAFAHDLDRSGQNALQELRWLSRLKPVLWWMIYANPGHTDFLSGFVWEEEGKIVGNITVNRTGAGSRRWLISNLAVAKPYRGRGIARSLLQTGLELVREYNGLSVSLQVRTDNEPAKHLYDTCNFEEISGKTQLWARRVPKVEYFPLPRRLLLRPRNFDIEDARHAFSLALVATPQRTQKEWPLRQNQFRLNSGERVNNYFRWIVGGGPAAFWVVEDGQRFVATINIRPGSWGQSHRIDLAVHPTWRGNLERPLISRALKYLYNWRGRSISIKQPSDHRQAIEVYKEFGLKEIQTLVWMKRNM